MNESQNPFEVMLDNLDLGSEAAANPFDLPATPVPPTLASEEPAPKPFDTAVPTAPTTEAQPRPAPDPIAAAFATLTPVEPQPESAQPEQSSIFTKPAVFKYGAAMEDIEDMAQTFENLRVAKAEDFPELEDAKRVSWEVVYGKSRKTIAGSDTGKKKISEVKAAIESSKEFLDNLKKSKDKNPACTVTPKVTAQSKGKLAAYKGVFATEEEALASRKVLCVVPSADGQVYEIRKEEAGIFVLQSARSEGIAQVQAGFRPALPRIPRRLLLKVISFFRTLMNEGLDYEAIANILWDRQEQWFVVSIPTQVVSQDRADSVLEDELDSNRYLYYMDIHSHNHMAAQFSARDDRDEQATRLYAVIGNLDEFMPSITVRMGCGGRFMELPPSEVFEYPEGAHPAEWKNQLTFLPETGFGRFLRRRQAQFWENAA